MAQSNTEETPEATTQEESGKEILFTKEYKGETQNDNDLENFVFEIGSRAQFTAGKTSTLVGYVKEKDTGEPIEGAIVYTPNGNKSAVTSADGFYSLNLVRN